MKSGPFSFDEFCLLWSVGCVTSIMCLICKHHGKTAYHLTSLTSVFYRDLPSNVESLAEIYKDVASTVTFQKVLGTNKSSNSNIGLLWVDFNEW